MLLEILAKHPNMMVRHEVAFVLLELEERNPVLMKMMRKDIIKVLSRRVKCDKSVVVKHEVLETLGYIGDKTCRKLLRRYLKSKNNDIKESALFALQLLESRLRKIPGSNLVELAVSSNRKKIYNNIKHKSAINARNAT